MSGRIVVAVDAKDGMVATRGWADVSTITAVDLACRFNDAGVASILFTDAGRDGLLKGANITATVHLARKTNMPVIASGRDAALVDIIDHARGHAEGIEGVIPGRSLITGGPQL